MKRASIDLDNITLKSGGHRDFEAGACLLELVSYIAGEPWSSQPKCVCPVLGAFGRSWNDALPDDEARNRILKPFVLRLLDTRSTRAVQDARAFMATDWAVRVYTPTWLRLIDLNDEADALEALPALTSTELCKAAMPTITKARTKSAAARDAAGDAAWGAAGAAAGAAAWGAAGDAARDAARAAARAAAWGVAGDAAAVAARDAARDAAAVVELLQVSAADLYGRMIDLTAVSA